MQIFSLPIVRYNKCLQMTYILSGIINNPELYGRMWINQEQTEHHFIEWTRTPTDFGVSIVTEK